MNFWVWSICVWMDGQGHPSLKAPVARWKWPEAQQEARRRAETCALVVGVNEELTLDTIWVDFGVSIHWTLLLLSPSPVLKHRCCLLTGSSLNLPKIHGYFKRQVLREEGPSSPKSTNSREGPGTRFRLGKIWNSASNKITYFYRSPAIWKCFLRCWQTFPYKRAHSLVYFPAPTLKKKKLLLCSVRGKKETAVLQSRK